MSTPEARLLNDQDALRPLYLKLAAVLTVPVSLVIWPTGKVAVRISDKAEPWVGVFIEPFSTAIFATVAEEEGGQLVERDLGTFDSPQAAIAAVLGHLVTARIIAAVDAA
jgi:hypothetical protein